MRKIDLILENIRDDYMINLLEEGTASELETLKTKKFLNENLSRIRHMLIEEGALEGVKQHLGDNWGKYLAGAGAGAGAGAAGMHGADVINDQLPLGTSVGNLPGAIGDGLMSGDPAEMAASTAATAAVPTSLAGVGAADYADQAGNAIGNAASAAGQLATDAAGNIMDAAGNVIGNIADFAQNVVG